MVNALSSKFVKLLPALLSLAVVLLNPALAVGREAAINIRSFTVTGNSIFTETELQAVLQPYLGDERHFADIQQAMTALQMLYRDQGYGESVVTIPAQELTAGQVRLQVTEALLKHIEFTYNPGDLADYYSQTRLQAILPALQAGTVLRSQDISENIQLANENPARKMDVLLSKGDRPGELNGEIRVSGLPPRKVYATLDNTGTAQTGEYRMGFGMQHANLWGRDHVATFNYITPLTDPQHVNLFSGSYRVPLYGWGDSIDMIAAKSDVANTTTNTIVGPLQFAGSGEIFALNYNFLLPRWGEYSQRLSTAYNYRQLHNNCAIDALQIHSCGPASHDITLMPLSLNYSGQLTQQIQTLNFYVLGAHNLPGMANGGQNDFNRVRPGPINGAPAAYTLFKAGYNYNLALPADWQLRLAANGQYSPNPLVYVEQFSLVGSAMVRGFWEREVTRDLGYVLNNELIGPNLAAWTDIGETLRTLVFYDYGQGRNNTFANESPQTISVSSVGFGVRLGFHQSLQLKFDGSYVLSGAASHPTGDVRGHLGLYLPYSF